MAPITPRPVRRRTHKRSPRGKKKNHIAKRSPQTQRSPRSILSRSSRNRLGKERARRTAGGLFTTTNTTGITKLRAKPVDRRDGPRVWKYSKVAMNWPSTEPFEKNCLERTPVPENYVFVPRGDVYVTRHCRSKTKESRRLVYKVYDNTGKISLGIRVPLDVYTTVRQSAAETADSRAKAVELRDEKDMAHSRQILRNQFPLMPADSLDIVLNHAFLKGSGRVGRTSRTTDERKAILAVEAHIRHTHTPYESLLRSGTARDEARRDVWGMVQAIKSTWEGRAAQPMSLLTLRNRIGE